MTTLTIEGAAVHDIGSLYDELNRVFMASEDWRLGPSLDALNDLLHGGFGALRGAGSIRVVWNDSEISRRALGAETTADYYREKLRHPETFNVAHFRGLLAALETEGGPTYFEIVLEVFADHPEIELVLG